MAKKNEDNKTLLLLGAAIAGYFMWKKWYHKDDEFNVSGINKYKYYLVIQQLYYGKWNDVYFIESKSNYTLTPYNSQLLKDTKKEYTENQTAPIRVIGRKEKIINSING